MNVTFLDVLKATLGFIVAAFMLYFPYFWCGRRGENEEDYGLRWFMRKGAWREALFATLFTLVPLTFVSFYWPNSWGRGGPFSPPLWTAVNQLGGGLAAAFVEETFYRGWMQTLCVRFLRSSKVGVCASVVFTSLLFSLSHLLVAPSWLRLATFFPGLVMGYLRHRNASVMPAIIYHGVCNVWAVWWMPR